MADEPDKDKKEEKFATLEEIGRLAPRKAGEADLGQPGAVPTEEDPYLLYEKDNAGLKPISTIKKPRISNIGAVNKKKEAAPKARVELPEE